MRSFLIFLVIFIIGHYLYLLGSNKETKATLKFFGSEITISTGLLVFMNFIDGAIVAYIVFEHLL